MKKRKYYPTEVLLWSIALPGFGQLLNGKFLKGITFIFLEVLVNVNANLNLNIKYSFQGEFEKAIAVTNYQWAMFYPCLYVFAMLDSYLDALKLAEQEPPSLIGLPFAAAAYLSTVGVVFSDHPALYNLLTPTFVPLTAMVIGFVIGEGIRKQIVNKVYMGT